MLDNATKRPGQRAILPVALCIQQSAPARGLQAASAHDCTGIQRLIYQRSVRQRRKRRPPQCIALGEFKGCTPGGTARPGTAILLLVFNRLFRYERPRIYPRWVIPQSMA